MFDCVVNYFFKDGFDEKVRASAMLSATCLRAEQHVGQVFIVDGSRVPDLKLKEWAALSGISYVHTGRELTFSEGYNAGAALCTNEWTVLCASDIYVTAGFFSKVAAYLDTLKEDSLGCAIPMLTSCDLPSQMPQRRTKIRAVPLMTLNLNIFRTETLRKLGGVGQTFSGNYNDVELTLKMRVHGLKTFLLPVLALHYGKMTTAAGSNVSLAADIQLFRDLYPDLALRSAFWGIKLSKFIDAPLLRAITCVESVVPTPFRAPFQRLLLSRIL